MAFFALTAGGYIFSEIMAGVVKRDISSMQTYLNSDEVLQKRHEVELKKKKLDILNKYYNALESASANIESQDLIKSSLMEKINTTIPKGVSIKTAAFFQNQIKIQATAQDRIAAAEFLHNMKSLGIFEKVHIGSLVKEGTDTGSYTFNIDCVLKEVNKQ